MGKWAYLAAVGGLLLASVTPARQGCAAEVAAKPEDPTASWSVLTPLDFDTVFQNVRYPHLDADGNVTFIADDEPAARKTGRYGIYRYQAANKKLVCLVRAGETTLPGSETIIRSTSGLQMDENGVDFIFKGGDSEGRVSLYHWSGGKLDTLASTKVTVLPGETEPLKGIQYGALHGTHVLYQATTAAGSEVLVLHDLKAGVGRIVFHTGMAIPGHDDEKFHYLAPQNWISGDSIIFRAGSNASPGRQEAKGTLGIYGWFGIKDWSDKSPDLAPGKLRTILDGSMGVAIPGVSEDATFDSVGSAPTNGNFTAFEASGDGFSGIFFAKTPGGPVRNIVSSHTEFDGPFKGQFSNFGAWPTVNGQNVVFTADAEQTEFENNGKEEDDAADDTSNEIGQTYKGVFVYRLDRGEVFSLADNRAKLAGKDVEDFEIGGHFMVKDHFVVTVNFKDKSSQIFMGTIRPAAMKKLDGEPANAAPKPTPAP